MILVRSSYYRHGNFNQSQEREQLYPDQGGLALQSALAHVSSTYLYYVVKVAPNNSRGHSLVPEEAYKPKRGHQNESMSGSCLTMSDDIHLKSQPSTTMLSITGTRPTPSVLGPQESIERELPELSHKRGPSTRQWPLDALCIRT